MNQWVAFFFGTPTRAIFWVCVAITIIAGFYPQAVLAPIHNMIAVAVALATQLINCFLPIVIVVGLIALAYRWLFR